MYPIHNASDADTRYDGFRCLRARARGDKISFRREPSPSSALLQRDLKRAISDRGNVHTYNSARVPKIASVYAAIRGSFVLSRGERFTEIFH